MTDASGLVLYDSLDEDAALGQYAVLPEIVQALGRNDVFYSSYGAGRLEQGGYPILYAGSLIGAVYMMEYDLDQGALIAALQQNIPSGSAWFWRGCDSLLLFFFRGVFQTYAADFCLHPHHPGGDYSPQNAAAGA